MIGVVAPELRPATLGSRRYGPPPPVPPDRRRRSRSLPALAFWLLAIAVGAAAVILRDPRIALAGTALAVPLAPWLGLREYAAWALNAAVLAVAFTDGVWIAMAVATIAVLVVPGLLLLEAATVPRHDVLRSPAYLPAASLVVLAVVGVSANFAAPRIDGVEPFTTYPMLIALDVALVLLALAAALRRPPPPLPTAALLHAWPRVRDAWPLLLPAGAAVGASALSSSGDRTITVAVLAAAVATLAVGLFLAGRRAPVRAALALYGAALACVYSFTLPGAEVFGWDITGEYATLTAVLEHGSWARLHEHDAYGAMLSLTVVPAALHALAGLAPVVILKAVYPALLALFPVLVFTVGCRIVAPRAAYLAALAIVAQAAFIQQLPAIARQEAALLEFGALLAVLADRELRPGTRRTLVAVFGTGVVVSHYSTAYMTIALLALGVVAGLALAVVRRGVRLLPRAAFALVVVVVAAATWYGPVTGSYSNAGDALQSIAADGLNVLPGASGQGPLDAYLRGNVVQNISAPTYEREVAARYAQSRPSVVPLPASRDARYALRDDPVPQTGDAAARRGLNSAVTAVLQLVNLLAIAGALTLALRRRASPVARLFGALSVGALGILAVARISGTIAATYNLERLEVQMLAVTGIGLALLLQRLARWHVTGRILTGLLALGLLVAVAAGAGLGAIATGAGGPANLSRSGEDAERFTITPAERAAAEWLAGHAPPDAQIYADRYAQLRLFAFAQRGSSFLTAVTPRTLDQHAVVYASRANWLDGRARDAVGADLATYAFPRAYLDAYYDRPYVSQQGAVYSR